MKFAADETLDEIIGAKRLRIADRRKAFYQQWLTAVAPRYLDRPLPELHVKPLPNEAPQLETTESCDT